MTHIVCVASNLAGRMRSILELARRLQAAGYRVTYASPSDLRAVAITEGLEYAQLDPGKDIGAGEQSGNGGRFSRWLALRARRRVAVDALGVSRFPKVLRELKPDLVLLDTELHAHIVSAVPSGIPVALLSTWMSIWKRPGLPPLHKDITPGIGWKGSRTGLEFIWLRFRLRKRSRAWRQKFQKQGVDWISVMRQHARDTGFPFRSEVEMGQWQIPFSYRSLPVLCLRAWELEFPHQPRPHVHYVGPMINDQRKDPDIQPGVEADLDRVFTRRRNCGDTRRLIYCGVSSFFATDMLFLRRLIQAFSDRPDWDLVLGLGNRVKSAELGPLPANVHAFPWVPQLRILEHADAAITHGGINTVDECVRSGVPMLVYSGGNVDMPGTTARVVYHGLGVAGDRKRDTPAAIVRRLERIIEDPDIETNIGRLREQARKYEIQGKAEQVVRELLTHHRPAGKFSSGSESRER